MLAEYLPLLVLFTLATGLGLIILGLSFLIGPRKPSTVKTETYESGMTAIGAGQRRMPVRFYLVATLFILFDIEVIFLFPWAVSFLELARPVPEGLGIGVLVEMGLFLGVLLLGFAYVWRKGALVWD